MRAKETWLEQVQGDPIPWLLEPENPSARYRTLVETAERADRAQRNSISPKTLQNRIF